MGDEGGDGACSRKLVMEYYEKELISFPHVLANILVALILSISYYGHWPNH